MTKEGTDVVNMDGRKKVQCKCCLRANWAVTEHVEQDVTRKLVLGAVISTILKVPESHWSVSGGVELLTGKGGDGREECGGVVVEVEVKEAVWVELMVG